MLVPYSKLPARERIGVPALILVLVCFVILGAVVHPKRHMNSYLRRGEEMARHLNEMQVQRVGLLFSCGSGWMLYELI